MMVRQLWDVLCLPEDARPVPCFMDEAWDDRTRDDSGAIPYWGNLERTRGDLLLAGSNQLLSPRAVDIIEKLGGNEFEKERARVYQHPSWTRARPPWGDGEARLRDVRSLSKYEWREYYEVTVPDETQCNCIDWASTKYGAMSRKRGQEHAVFPSDPRLVEPRRGFPLVFEVLGLGGLYATDEGRQRMEAAGLQFLYLEAGVRSVKWQPSKRGTRSAPNVAKRVAAAKKATAAASRASKQPSSARAQRKPRAKKA